MVTVIPLDSFHLTDVGKIEKECFSDPWSEASFASVCNNEMYAYFIALDSESKTVCGYAGMYSVLDSAEITGIAVIPDRRKEGIGSMLVGAIIAEAKRRGVSALHLEVRETNSAAIGLYKKFNFVADGKRKNYYRMPTEDAILMTKHII